MSMMKELLKKLRWKWHRDVTTMMAELSDEARRQRHADEAKTKAIFGGGGGGYT